MDEPIAGYPAYFGWAGQRWYLNKRNGYYLNSDGKLLHRHVWMASNGEPVTEEHEVHHLDHDRSNNSPSNLERMLKTEHKRHHGTDRGDERWLKHRDATREVRSANSRAQWAKREPIERACQVCKNTFWSTGTRAAYCGSRCAQESARRRSGVTGWTPERREEMAKLKKEQWAEGRSGREPRSFTCGECGTQFWSNAGQAKWCSRSCGSKAEYRRRLERRASGTA